MLDVENIREMKYGSVANIADKSLIPKGKPNLFLKEYINGLIRWGLGNQMFKIDL